MPLVVPVKFHYASKDLWFDPQGLDIVEGDYAVCRTERGTEIGLVTADPFEADEDELAAPLKPVLYIATDEDLDRADELARKGEEAMPDFRRLIEKNGLDMKPVGVEYLFGGEKLVFYFAAEDRVDFRQLVRDLSSCFHTRVDMRQIGVRDEARLVGGYAQCGQELCCARFGGNFEPVSIRMAKEQDLPLNSSKISGVCGRLMCCLRYEFDAYKDFKSRAPKKKAVISTPLGKARIVEYNTPLEQLTLRLENGKAFTVDLADMTCSDEAQKRADEQGYTCRPDCVTRDVLEKIDSAEMRMALVELDRKNGVDVGDGIDSADIIEDDSGQGRRSSRNGQPRGSSSGSSSNRSSRNRSGGGQGQNQGQGGRGSGSRGQGGKGQGQNQGNKSQRQGQNQGQGGQGTGSGGGSSSQSSRRRRTSASNASGGNARQGQDGQRTQQSSDRREGQGSQQASSHRRRQHVSASSDGQSASGTAQGQRTEGGSSGSSSQSTGSRPRKHTTASSGSGTQSSTGSGSSKPSVPSVADQVSDGSVAVNRRHPGDGGGSGSGSTSDSGSGHVQGGDQYRSSGNGQQNSQGSASSGQQSRRRRRHRSSGSQSVDGNASSASDQAGSSGQSGGFSRSDGSSSSGTTNQSGASGPSGASGSSSGSGPSGSSGSGASAPSGGSDGTAVQG